MIQSSELLLSLLACVLLCSTRHLLVIPLKVKTAPGDFILENQRSSRLGSLRLLWELDLRQSEFLLYLAM